MLAYRFSSLFLLIVLRQGHATPDLTVPTRNGPVAGILRGTTATWWGLRFAEPPTGARRFKPPQPLEQTWTEPVSAAHRRQHCLQHIPVLGTKGGEDCLFLNVFAPADAMKDGATKRPVMVWIYGGGYEVGDSYQLGLYDGQHLSERHDLVVVTLNYRLSFLGFFALDALRNESGTTGNYGVQDQQQALRWVQENIANFGGDSSRVTIFGESAGAFSVMWQLVNPHSAGLFHAAIMESGTSSVSWFFQPYHLATAFYEGVAEELGCGSNGDAKAQLDCLRGVEPHHLVFMQMFEGPPPGGPATRSTLWPIMPVGPVLDGTSYGLLDVPIKLVQAGKFHQVPLMLGANENGGSIFEPMLPYIVPGAVWPAALAPSVTAEKAMTWFFGNYTSRVGEVYTMAEFKNAESPADAFLSRLIRDVMFQCSNRALATSWASAQLPTYLYVFHYDFGFIDRVTGLKDFHGGEMPFVFRNWLRDIQAISPLQDPYKMADIMSCKWASFAYTLDPNGGKDEEAWPPHCMQINRQYSDWPRFNSDQRLLYSLKSEPAIHQILADNRYPDDLFPRDEKCDLWDELAPQLPWILPQRPATSLAVIV